MTTQKIVEVIDYTDTIEEYQEKSRYLEISSQGLNVHLLESG